MSSTAQIILVFLAIVLSYVWVSVPQLEYYSLQLVAAVILLYFGIKRFSKSSWSEIAPRALTAELAILTVGFLVFISSTGNMDSLFFPLSYIYLFFLVIALRPLAAIIASLGIMFFHYQITPTLTPDHISTLLSLPLLLFVFLFTKKQYESHQFDQQALVQQEEKLDAGAYTSKMFIKTFLQPKLEMLFQLSLHPEINQANIQEQIKLIHEESEHLLTQSDHDNTTS